MHDARRDDVQQAPQSLSQSKLAIILPPVLCARALKLGLPDFSFLLDQGLRRQGAGRCLPDLQVAAEGLAKAVE